MATFNPLPGLVVEAVQWLGQWVVNDVIPSWVAGLGAHAPSDGTLHVPCHNGIFAAVPSDWIVKGPTGAVTVVPNSIFTATYDVEAADKEAAATKASSVKDTSVRSTKKD